MLIFNDTKSDVAYGLTCASCSDCGQLKPGDHKDWPSYDEYSDVTVNFVPMPYKETGFEITTAGSNTVRIALTASKK
jgi:hypothetical protein